VRIVAQDSHGAPGEIILDDFLAKPLFCHLATVGTSGPCDSPLWFSWESNALWFIANRNDSFPRRILADGRAAVGIVDFDVAKGRVHHVGLRGFATLEPWDARRADRLLRRYLGQQVDRWDPRFRATVDDEDNSWVRFAPDTVVVRDQSYAVMIP
jgi:hypothetical protein